MKRILLPLFLLSISFVRAQEPSPEPTPTTPEEPSQEEPRGPRPPKSPIMEVLDANRDHKIDKDEIAGASEALLKLDKNGDGELTPEEFRPKPPQQNETGQEMSPSERRRQERQERRESRQQGGQQQQGPAGGGPGGPPPPPPQGR